MRKVTAGTGLPICRGFCLLAYFGSIEATRLPAIFSDGLQGHVDLSSQVAVGGQERSVGMGEGGVYAPSHPAWRGGHVTPRFPRAPTEGQS